MSEVYDRRKQLTAGIPTFSMRQPDARVAGEAPSNDPHAKAGAITLTDGQNLTVDVGCGPQRYRWCVIPERPGCWGTGTYFGTCRNKELSETVVWSATT